MSLMKRFLQVAGLSLFLFSCKGRNETPVAEHLPDTTENSPGKQVVPLNFTSTDISPMDMVYFPVDYPLLKMTGKISTPPLARVIYSRPHKAGRVIFGDLVKYDIPWRLGANESTELELFSPVKIQDKTVEAGRYVLYCIPHHTTWTLILNANLYSWGLRPEPGEDLLKFEIPVEKISPPLEHFTILFQETASGANLLFLWDDVKAALPMQF